MEKVTPDSSADKLPNDVEPNDTGGGMRFVAFDLEVAEPLPPGNKLWWEVSGYSPGVTCAATLTDTGERLLWYGPRRSDGRLANKMGDEYLAALVDYLLRHMDAGRPPLTWNGVGFDFRVLARECPSRAQACAELALKHYDPGFQMLTDKGYMIGLDVAAEALDVSRKLNGMTGAGAPILWLRDPADQEKVLRYVAQDVKVTSAIVKALLRSGVLENWKTQAGGRAKFPWWPSVVVGQTIFRPEVPRFGDKPRSVAYQQAKIHQWRLLTILEVLEIQQEDNSWMDKPLDRYSMIDWLNIPPPEPDLDGWFVADPDEVLFDEDDFIV